LEGLILVKIVLHIKNTEFGGQTVWECMETEPEQTKEKITDVGK
jgi:hypothetical protein